MTDGSHRQRMLDFFNVLYSGDIEGALAQCTDDVEFLANAPVDILPHMGHRRGKAELREMWTAVRARYSEIGAIGGALLFGVIAIRDAEIAIEREPVRHRER